MFSDLRKIHTPSQSQIWNLGLPSEIFGIKQILSDQLKFVEILGLDMNLDINFVTQINL